MTHDDLTNTGCASQRGITLLLGVWLASAAIGCGVHAYPQAQAAVNPNNDFGPPAGTSTTAGSPDLSNPVVQMPGTTAGTTGTLPVITTGGVAGSLILPTAGIPALMPMGTAGAAAGPGAIAGSGGMAGAMMPTMMPTSGLTLGDATVAKENVIAFIHIGHSNMAGRAIGPTATRPYFFTETDPHAWMYHTGKPPALAKEPDTADDDLSGTYGGPGTALIKQAVGLAPDKYFMSLGFGKESAYCSQFLPGALYYDTLIAAPKAIKDKVTFGAIVIMLGITERHGTAADVTGYSGCINQLVTAIRTDVGRPDLPLLITDYEQLATGDLAIDQPFAQSIIPEIHKIPMVVSNSVLVPTDGLGMQDDHHFNFDGHKVWTGRLLQIMKDKGWFPWQ
jgi:hypothetical protein